MANNNTSSQRLGQISAHLDNSKMSGKERHHDQPKVHTTKTAYWDAIAIVFQNVPQAPADVIFSLTAGYKADTHPQKINVGVGAFRTDELKPYVLPVVKKV